MSMEKVARALCTLDGFKPDEVTVKPDDTTTGETLYMWQRYSKEAARHLELINAPRGRAILEAAGWSCAPSP